MTDFTFWSPTYFAFGRGAEARAGEFVRRFGGRKALLHYGGKSAVASGLIGRVKSSLAEAGVEFVELGGVKPNPRSSLIEEGVRLALAEGVDFLLAVGGGSVIDSAKGIAIGESDADAALAGIGAFRRWLKSLGLPLTFAELGAREEDIPLLVKTLNLSGNTLGGFRPLDEADVAAIYRMCL